MNKLISLEDPDSSAAAKSNSGIKYSFEYLTGNRVVSYASHEISVKSQNEH